MNYSTSNLYIAALLRAFKYEIVKVTRSGNRYFFHFGNIPDETIDDLLNDYYNDKVAVKAKSFVDSVRELKSRLHDTPK
jgi:hypothetical protein